MQDKPAKKGGIFGWVNDLREQQKGRVKQRYNQVDSESSPELQSGSPITPARSSAISPFLRIGNPIVLSGHTNSVYAIAFSPIGQLLASASSDYSIRLWHAESGANIATLKGDSQSIAFSPDGTKLASGLFNGTIKLWDVGSKVELAIFKGHSGSVKSVAFSPDGAYLASGSYDSTVRLWDMKSRTSINALSGHSSYVCHVAFSPDSKRIASGSHDCTIRVWNLTSGTALATLNGHSQYVMSVAFSPNGKYLASGSYDKTIQLWDVDKKSRVSTMKGYSGVVSSVAFSPDGNYLASGSYDKTIHLWDVATRSHITALQGHSNDVNSVEFSPDGTRLASGSDDTTARIWRIFSEGARDSRAVFTSDLNTANSQQSTLTSPSSSTSLALSNDITGSVTLKDNSPIGYGGFGDLFLGVHKDHGKVALKKPRRLLNEALIRRFLREVDLWCSVSHRYVLPCLGMCKIGTEVYVVSPFIENGDLLSCMARGMVLNHNKLLFEVAEALMHLHHRGIVHGDVKAQNILLSDDGSALLCDFGLAKAFDTMVTSTESKGAGSVRWMAPELILGESRSMASDVYSLGITIAEVLSGRPPFHDILDNVAVMFHIASRDGRPPKEPSHSPEGKSYATLWETAAKCWVKNDSDRPTMAQVLAMLFPLTRERS